MRTIWLVGAAVLLLTGGAGPLEEGPAEDPAEALAGDLRAVVDRAVYLE